MAGPDYITPDASTAENWIEFNNPAVISHAHAVSDDEWWLAFGDADIPRFVQAANAQNLTVQAALLRVQEQHYRRAVAVGNLLPQGQEFFAEYQRQQFSENGNQFGFPAPGNSFSLYQAGFNASWELDLFGRLRRTAEAASAKLDATIEDERDLRLCLTADVVAAYAEIRVFQERLRYAHEQIAAQEETLRIATAKFDKGATSNLDVSQATATLAVIKATTPELQTGLREANNRLCLLLGRPPQDLTMSLAPSSIPLTPESIVVGVPRDLIRRRPDIRRAERAIAAESALIGVAKADLFPTFSLRGTINWQSFVFPDLFSTASNAGAIIPGVRWDVLNYGRIKNRISAQETRFEEAVVNYRQVVLGANTEVENTLNAYLRKKEQVEFVRNAAKATREALDTGSRQYKAGAIEFDRVNNLRKQLVTQLDSVAVEEGKAVLLLVQLYKALGGGWTVSCNSSIEFSVAPVMQGTAAESFHLQPTGPVPPALPNGGTGPQLIPQLDQIPVPPEPGLSEPVPFSIPPANHGAGMSSKPIHILPDRSAGESVQQVGTVEKSVPQPRSGPDAPRRQTPWGTG
ncbi:MAG: efflux transporter outer membrane subunit [Planctomycetaceae bacterium]